MPLIDYSQLVRYLIEPRELKRTCFFHLYRHVSPGTTALEESNLRSTLLLGNSCFDALDLLWTISGYGSLVLRPCEARTDAGEIADRGAG